MATNQGLLNMLDLIANQENDPLTGLVEDVPIYAPEFAQIPVTVKSGTSYRIVKRTALPAAQFRQVNQGINVSKSSYKQEVKEMFPLDIIINVDEMIVQGDDESSGGDILTKEAHGALQSAIIYLGAQTWYGTSNDANGFSGLRAQTIANVAAGGSTNTTSVYLVWLHEWGVNFPIGRKGQISMKPWWYQQVVAANPGTTGASNFMAYVSNISAWIGLTVASNYSVFAITGLDAPGASSHQMTDKLGAQLLSYVPMTRRQGLCWFMNRNAHFQLQNSRSAIGYQPGGPGGTPAWAAIPDSIQGYPIVVSDSITNIESN